MDALFAVRGVNVRQTRTHILKGNSIRSRGGKPFSRNGVVSKCELPIACLGDVCKFVCIFSAHKSKPGPQEGIVEGRGI